jgi:hypothetical protein
VNDPKPWTVRTCEVTRSIAEVAAWNDSLPAFDPGPIPDAKPPKPKPGSSEKGRRS